MLNKILSKKIKSPLLLLGLFPFCHSRESGNPSSLSLRGAKQRSNLNGFSLIELMIAITILAVAVFGIFHAYSVGFLGMADARDRTVATNYAREAMEDVKNMDFELVTNENLGIAESVGEKFTRVISVNTENGNLKNITTLVYWNNRNGKTINIETSMYINRTLFNPGEATKIVLYASPYYAVLPSDDETVDLFAVIKDVNGNTKIDWSGENICFTIFSGSELGSLPAGAGDGADTNNGIAQTVFTPSGYKIGEVVQQGNVVIEASVTLPDGSTVSDTVTIAITLGVIRIELNASPTSIDADGTTTSKVTAELVDAKGDPVSDAPNEITFDISGEGTFVDSALGGASLPDTYTMSNSGGEAIIYVESIADKPGVATVIASSEGLLSDTVNISTTGVATSIFVSVEPNLIYEGGNATVTVEIQDINGNPVEYSGDISLAISGGTGTFVDNPVDPNNTPFAYSTFTPSSLGMLTIMASGVDLIDGTTTIEVGSVLIADTITIKAVPKNILAGGIDVVSEITATIKQGSIVISNYDHDITFKIISDTSTSESARFSDNTTYVNLIGNDYENDGEATVQLLPASDVGIATIEVSTVNSLGDLIKNTVKVGFYSSEDHIELSADPSKMLVNGDTCTVTATVVDEKGNTVGSYKEDITFTILVGWPKIAKFALTGTSSLTTTLDNGEITVDLISQSKAGTVTLKATSFTGMTDIIGYLNIAVEINFLDLADPPNIAYDDGLKKVSFDIEVQGAGVILEEMQVLWLPYSSEENVTHIIINTQDVYPPGDNGIIEYSIYTYNSENYRSAEVDINDEILPAGISTIEIFFNSDMSEKELIIIFNPSSEYYPVGFTIPAPAPLP